MPNINNEGFAITHATECVADRRPVFWADDGETLGHSIRSGMLPCSPVLKVADTIAPMAFPSVSPAANAAGFHNSDVTVLWNWTDNLGGTGIHEASCAESTRSTGEGTIMLSAKCSDWAGNTGNATVTVKVDRSQSSAAEPALGYLRK